MAISWYYWLFFLASWLFSIIFWIKSSIIYMRWLKILFVICGLVAFFLPFLWGWMLSQ